MGPSWDKCDYALEIPASTKHSLLLDIHTHLCSTEPSLLHIRHPPATCSLQRPRGYHVPVLYRAYYD